MKFWSITQHIAKAWWISKGCGARGLVAVLLNPNQSLRRYLILPNPTLPLSSSLLFLLSGGSECSGLHVLSRCVGIGENIKVKTKGAEKNPRQLRYLCKYLCLRVSREEHLFAYTGVCVRQKGRYFYSHSMSLCTLFCVQACICTKC